MTKVRTFLIKRHLKKRHFCTTCRIKSQKKLHGVLKVRICFYDLKYLIQFFFIFERYRKKMSYYYMVLKKAFLDFLFLERRVLKVIL